ncbi:MAG: ribonuclease III [Candidatus Lloydbacteria bacterium RIFCSPHIGHO2_02_FULL_51_22]|uniref:Ribonuclease 3 n=2 Tax=Candidatus Lloydiibacteriota TaxID=1817910 RepID=A0A1G2DFF9_9BACT|nr:MAG: ribonuclease III [Candidatus Lloydbacteria bacterium RIFCSPHIGHO2_02_FULL_51_22]OGZ14824.1 MAG: ribonuclease III [Candidatus Lloydbacteria bacterium RIFCSPLOWO2_02_FULL_51_11]
MDFSQFEKRTGVVFKDTRFLLRAFTHRSYLNEHPKEKIEHNERFEFLGDAVLELAVTVYLFNRFPERPEGELTAFRAALVNTMMLSDTALELGFSDFLLLSRGEAKDVGKARQYILANTYEAVVGAIFLDQGYREAEAFIARTLLGRLDSVLEKGTWQDAKSSFQENAQEILSVTPSYKVLSELGPDHDREFTVGVFLGEEEAGKGEGKSKQEAEQNAARNALEKKGWK